MFVNELVQCEYQASKQMALDWTVGTVKSDSMPTQIGSNLLLKRRFSVLCVLCCLH